MNEATRIDGKAIQLMAMPEVHREHSGMNPASKGCIPLFGNLVTSENELTTGKVQKILGSCSILISQKSL